MPFLSARLQAYPDVQLVVVLTLTVPPNRIHSDAFSGDATVAPGASIGARPRPPGLAAFPGEIFALPAGAVGWLRSV